MTTWPESLLKCQGRNGSAHAERQRVRRVTLDQLCFEAVPQNPRQYGLCLTAHKRVSRPGENILEFQEGTRKHKPGAATKHYHGMWMPHVHIVFWCVEAIRNSRLLCWLQADLARDFQDYTLLSFAFRRWPITTDPFASAHSEEDKRDGILPYLAPLCQSEICHSNVSFISHPGTVSD